VRGLETISLPNGKTLNLGIFGSGEDRDTWVGQDPVTGTMTGGQDLDPVTIEWFLNGALSDCNGTHFSFTPSAAGYYDIRMRADDGGALPPGDSGTRDDAPVIIDARLTVIWVTIAGKFSGDLHDDNPLDFCSSYPEIQGNCGKTGPSDPITQGGTDHSWSSKVEFIGTVEPEVPDGSNIFTWIQKKHFRVCGQDANGQWFSMVGNTTFQDETTASSTQFTVDSRVFFIDAPGVVGTHAPAGVQRVYAYQEFKLHIEYDFDQASDVYYWHHVVKLETTPGSSLLQPISGSYLNVGPGLAPMMPADDCSTQP